MNSKLVRNKLISELSSIAANSYYLETKALLIPLLILLKFYDYLHSYLDIIYYIPVYTDTAFKL